MTKSIMECAESKLAKALRLAQDNTLARRIGQRMANTTVSDEVGWALIQRLWDTLSIAERLEARGEAALCRAAKRGEHMARVAA